MKATILCLFLFPLLLGARESEQNSTEYPPLPPGQKWALVWKDEFAGSKLDESKWEIIGDSKRRDGYWVRNDAYVDGKGNLILRTTKDGERYTCGAVRTLGTFEHAFGYWVVRCKFPKEPGHWPAFWLMSSGVNKAGNDGRDGTEIDIVEAPWRNGQITMNLHWDGYGKDHKSAGTKVTLPELTSGFHTFALWWRTNEYIFYADGKETWRSSAGGVSQAPEYLKLTEEIGKWGGDISAAKLPDYFEVDYVRVYDVVPDESLATLATQVRPGFLLGSFASGFDPARGEAAPRAEFFRRNFNIMTAGVYMNAMQRTSADFDFTKLDALISFADTNKLKVYLHPLIGGEEYTPKWVNDGGFSPDALREIMRHRITTILNRYRGRVHYVDVVNESLTGTGRKANEEFDWQVKAWKGGDHVWMKTLGMYQGRRHQFPAYLVEAFRIARETAGANVKLILNEWGNETTKSLRGAAFLELVKALREEGIPVDGAGLQMHSRIKDGVFCDWLGKPFDFDAFDAMLKLYERNGIDVHITEFDIHLPSPPTPADFELQGRYYPEVLKHAIASPAVKSFKTWGFTDGSSWKAEGVDGHPLLLDEKLQPKPAYVRQIEMLKSVATN